MTASVYPQMSVSTLLKQFAAYNPRRLTETQFKALQNSIREFGFVEPVIVNTLSNTIVGGHQRVRAAQALGLEEVPVLLGEWTPDQEKALNVALNRVSGDWDSQLLIELLEGLDEPMRELTGFEDAELTRLLEDPFTTDIDEPPTKIAEPRFTIGQLKTLARNIYPTESDTIIDFLDLVEREAGE